MDLQTWIAPIAVLIAALPLLVMGIAVRRGNLGLINGLETDRVREAEAVAAKLGNLLLALAGVLVAAAPGYLWAGDDDGRVMLVTLALIVSVNALALWLVFAVAAVKRDYKPLSRQPDRRG